VSLSVEIKILEDEVVCLTEDVGDFVENFGTVCDLVDDDVVFILEMRFEDVDSFDEDGCNVADE